MKLSVGRAIHLLVVCLLVVTMAAAGLWGHWMLASIVGAILMIGGAAPLYMRRISAFHFPTEIAAPLCLFLYATLALGESLGFYERFWWWDLAVHTGAALGLGIAGFLFMLILIGRRSLDASPGTAAFFAFCFAVAIGGLWEVTEFTLDQALGLSMQNGSLLDTMLDMIVDVIGAAIGAMFCYAHLSRHREDFFDRLAEKIGCGSRRDSHDAIGR